MSNRRDSKVLGFGTLVIVFALCTVLVVQTGKANKRDINNKISSTGGAVVSIDERSFYIGPFHYVGKGQRVYKIVYTDKDGTAKEAWMRTGWSDDWVWDYKEDK